MPTTRETYPIEFRGGLLSNMSPLQQGINMPGSARVLKNFEPSIEGGYRRIEGYSKYDDNIIPPYGAPVVTGAGQSGTTLNIANIRKAPVAGDTLKIIHATAAVNGAISNTTALVLDTNVGTLAAGMEVTGTGISGTVTIASVTNQNNIVLSSAQTLTDDVDLTFFKVYTIATGGVSFNSTNKSAALTLTSSLLDPPSNGQTVEFVSTTNKHLTLGVGVFVDQVIVAKNQSLFRTSGNGYTLINVPSYGTSVLVNGASQTGTSLAIDGLTSTPQIGDVFKIAAAGPTAVVNGATSSTTALVVDGNVGTIVAGMTVSGDGIPDGVTVASLSNQNNLVLSAAQSVANDVALTFSITTDKIYAITSTPSVSSGGSTLTIAPALASSPADNAVITFLSTSRESASKTRFSRYNYSGTEKIAIVDGVNTPALYDRTSFTDLNDAPNDVVGAKFVVSFKNQLLFAKGSNIAFTAPYTDNDFTAANGAGTINVGNEVTGLIVFREQLIIFTESSIQRLVGNTVSDFQLQPITTDIGCIDEDTMQEIGGDVMFLAPDGLRLLSATERLGDFGLSVVSKPIQEEATSFISSHTSFTSVVIRKKSQYRILGYKTNLTNRSSKGILGTQFSGQGGEGMAWAEVQGINAHVADSRFYLGKETVVFSNDDGYLYSMENGSSFDGGNVETSFATPYLPISDPRVRKTFYKMLLYTDPRGSVSFDISLKLDFDQKNSVQPTKIDFSNQTGQVAFFGSTTFGSSAVYSSKLLTLFESQMIGTGYVVSLQFTSDSTDPPFSLDAITLEYGTNTRR